MPSSARIEWVTAVLATLFATPGHMDPAWADLKDFGNRLEGTLNRGFTEADVELVSFTGLPITYSMNSPATLDVWFFGSAAGLTIRAKELSPRLFYAMESKPGKWTDGAWNSLRPWSTTDMLIPLGVQANTAEVAGLIASWLEALCRIRPREPSTTSRRAASTCRSRRGPGLQEHDQRRLFQGDLGQVPAEREALLMTKRSRGDRSLLGQEISRL